MKSVCRLIKQMKVAAGFFKSGKSSYHLALLLLTSSSTSMALLLMSMPTSALLFLLSELLSQFSRMILQLLMVAESTSPMFHSFIINNLQHLLMFMVYHTTKHKYLLLCIFTRWIYQKSGEEWSNSSLWNLEKASHAHGIWPSATTL